MFVQYSSISVCVCACQSPYVFFLLVHACVCVCVCVPSCINILGMSLSLCVQSSPSISAYLPHFLSVSLSLPGSSSIFVPISLTMILPVCLMFLCIHRHVHACILCSTLCLRISVCFSFSVLCLYSCAFPFAFVYWFRTTFPL